MKPDLSEILFWRFAKCENEFQIARRFEMQPGEVMEKIASGRRVHSKLIDKFMNWARIPDASIGTGTVSFPEYFGDGKSSFPERLNHYKQTNELI